jgi:hypothetical protein
MFVKTAIETGIIRGKNEKVKQINSILQLESE